MATTILDRFNASDKADQIHKNKTKEPITDRKLRDEQKLEQARRGKVESTKRYSDSVN